MTSSGRAPPVWSWVRWALCQSAVWLWAGQVSPVSSSYQHLHPLSIKIPGDIPSGGLFPLGGCSLWGAVPPWGLFPLGGCSPWGAVPSGGLFPLHALKKEKGHRLEAVLSALDQPAPSCCPTSRWGPHAGHLLQGHDALEQVSLEQVSLEQVSLEQVSLEQVSLEQVSLEQVSLEQVSLEQVSLEQVSLEQVSLEQVSLEQVSLEQVSLEQVSLEQAGARGERHRGVGQLRVHHGGQHPEAVRGTPRPGLQLDLNQVYS